MHQVVAIAYLLLLVSLCGCGGTPPANAATPQGTWTIAESAFIKRFMTDDNRERSAIMYIQNGNLTKSWESIDALFRVPGHHDMILAICFSDDAPATHRMQLQLRRPIPDSDALMSQSGDPLIISTFDSNQAAILFERGVPDRLRQHMVETAIENGWSENRPLNGRFGQILEIDAQPYLNQ